MNRAASYVFAASVALVLSASPAMAGKKVVTFPKAISHTRVISHDALNAYVGSDAVSKQSIADRSGNNVVEFKPKGVKTAPKAPIYQRMKNALQTNAAKAILSLAIMASVEAVGWVMTDGTLSKRIDGSDASTTGIWSIQPWGFKGSSPAAAAGAYVSWYNSANAVINFKIRFNHAVTSGSSSTLYFDEDLNTGSYSSNTNTKIATFIAPCQYGYVNGVCATSPTFRPLTDSDFNAYFSSLDGKSAADFEHVYQAFVAIDPTIGMFLPDYLTAPDGTYVQAMASPLLKTEIARLNPDGTTSRLTRKSWADFALNYSPTVPEINYTVTNKSEVTNEAGEKVEEESQKEEDDEVAPESPNALDAANEPLKSWATEIASPPSSTQSGIAYPLLFTYGGTCSMPVIVLPRLGSYSLDSVCEAINTYVKPVLAVLFAAWTILHIFGVWRETTLTVRPS